MVSTYVSICIHSASVLTILLNQTSVSRCIHITLTLNTGILRDSIFSLQACTPNRYINMHQEKKGRKKLKIKPCCPVKLLLHDFTRLSFRSELSLITIDTTHPSLSFPIVPFTDVTLTQMTQIGNPYRKKSLNRAGSHAR